MSQSPSFCRNLTPDFKLRHYQLGNRLDLDNDISASFADPSNRLQGIGSVRDGDIQDLGGQVSARAVGRHPDDPAL
jgi:hypothetical protein